MIIDVHTHLTARALHIQLQRPDTLPFPSLAYGSMDLVNSLSNLEYMDQVGIDQCVLLPLPVPPGMLVPPTMTLESVLQVASVHPDRFIPFGTFDPRRPGPSYARQIEALVDMGCRGFGEWKPNPPGDSLRVDDPRAQEIYGLCGEHRLPILLHMDSHLNRDIDGFERMVAAFPDTIFIAHGPTWWAEISSSVPEGVDYPTGPIEGPGRVDRMLDRYPNLYADISAGSGLRALTRDPEFTKGFFHRHWDRLMLGTDYPGRNGASGQALGMDRMHLDLVREQGLPRDKEEAVLSGNLLKVLRPA
ncbi:MAG: amidohydrolase family protein [Anaerolineae bacterium]|jgi:predicted TIM-barrel fold metal-dependent hydrolase